MVRQLTAGLEHFFGDHFFGDPLSFSADTTLMFTMLMLNKYLNVIEWVRDDRRADVHQSIRVPVQAPQAFRK